MPKGTQLVKKTIERIESLTLTLLLPIFFVLTGLRTRTDLLHMANTWGYVLAIIGVAVLGKLGGAALTSRASGLAWRDAFALGILMNTRGLVELVILNTGLDLGILSSSMFSMMVLMALITTFMTTPLLTAVHGRPERGTRAWYQQPGATEFQHFR